MKARTVVAPLLPVLLLSVAGGNAHGRGSFAAWGWDEYGQCTSPASETVFEAVSAGDAYNLGLTSDGSIMAWGDNYFGACNVPEPNTGFVAVAALSV